MWIFGIESFEKPKNTKGIYKQGTFVSIDHPHSKKKNNAQTHLQPKDMNYDRRTARIAAILVHLFASHKTLKWFMNTTKYAVNQSKCTNWSRERECSWLHDYTKFKFIVINRHESALTVWSRFVFRCALQFSMPSNCDRISAQNPNIFELMTKTNKQKFRCQQTDCCYF